VRILITGVAGFIGSHLLSKMLELNFEVYGVDNFSSGKESNIKEFFSNNNFYFTEGDIRERKFTDKVCKSIDVVIHLAALADIVPSIETPDDYFSTNVLGTFNIVESARINKVNRIIYSASSSCYGASPVVPTGEQANIDTVYPYALTKYMGEQLLLHWCQVYKLSGVSLRLFNVYGLRARTSGTYGAVFGVFMAQKRAGKPLTIVGDGKQQRDFVHVSDVVDAISLALIDSDLKGIYNVGTGTPYSINHVASLIGGPTVNIPKRPGEPDITCADIKKIKDEFSWAPKVSIEQGILELKNNLNDWANAPIWDEKSIEIATKKWFEFLN